MHFHVVLLSIVQLRGIHTNMFRFRFRSVDEIFLCHTVTGPFFCCFGQGVANGMYQHEPGNNPRVLYRTLSYEAWHRGNYNQSANSVYMAILATYDYQVYSNNLMLR